MRLSRFLSCFSFTCASLFASAGIFDVEPRADTYAKGNYLLLEVKSHNAEEAARLVKGLGTLEGKLRYDKRIRVRLNPGVSMETAIGRLGARPEVASVVHLAGFDDTLFATSSLNAMKERMELLEERAEKMPEEDREELEAMEAIRRREAGGKGYVPKDKEIGEGSGMDFWEARQHYIRQRAYPNDSIDAEAYDRAVKHREAMPATALSGGSQKAGATVMATQSRWEFMGPRNLNGPANIYFGVRPAAGRINNVTYDPTNNSVFYVATAGGGVWKGTNNGATMTPLSDQWPFMLTQCVAVEPNNGNVIYVGTGDYDGLVSLGCYGIMKSLDGGNTWKQLGAAEGFTNFAVADIVISPDASNYVIAALGRGKNFAGGVWRSTDSGNTWSLVNGTAAAWSDLAVGIKGPTGRYFYAAACGGLLYRSSNQGLTWTQLTVPGTPVSSSYPLDVATSPTDWQTVYVQENANHKIYKSTNGGTTWTDITGNLDPGPGGYNFSQTFYDNHLTVSKNGTTDVLYCGLVDIFQSIGANGTWRTLGFGWQPGGQPARVHVDHHGMAFKPGNDNEALVTCDGGVYRFIYTPANDTWTFTGLNASIGITQFYAFDVHPTNPDMVIGGAQDLSSPSSKDGDLNNWQAVAGGDGGFAAINPVDPNNQYATAQSGFVHRTDDNWATIQYIAPPIGSDQILFIAPMEIDHNNPDNLYLGTNYLWRYNRSTGFWTARLGGINLAPGLGAAVSAIQIAPGDSNRLYVGTSNGRVWYSSNGGANWVQINTGSPGLPNRYVNSISVNPSNINEILVGVGGTGTAHLWKCADVTAATRVWTNVSGAGATGLPDIPLADVVRDPDDVNNGWHVATDVGVFSTFDGGANWSNSTAPLGLPNVQCNMLRLRGRTLYVATYGRGIWRMDLPATKNPVTQVQVLQNNILPTAWRYCWVYLQNPAGPGGEVVSVTSSHPWVVVPPTVTVPEGQTNVRFVLQHVNGNYASQLVTITCSRPGSIKSTTITAYAANAQFISQAIPPTMFAGEPNDISLTFKNNGGASWTAADNYKLQSKNPLNNTTWGFNRILLPPGTVVPSTQSYTYKATVTAPTTPGTYNMQWGPWLDNVGQFGAIAPNVAVNVVANANASQFVSQTVPATVDAGSDFVASFSMKNIGSTTWTQATGYELRAASPHNNPTWSVTSLPMLSSDTVAPNSDAAFSQRTLLAPLTAGTYSMAWRMAKSNVPFGPTTTPLNINVVNGPYNAQFVANVNVPTTVAANANFTAGVTFKNTGTSGWTFTDGVGMMAKGPSANSIWGTTYVWVPSGVTVAPGANYTFQYTFKAPATPGTYNFQWRVRQRDRFNGFGQYSTPVTITVT